MPLIGTDFGFVLVIGVAFFVVGFDNFVKEISVKGILSRLGSLL